MSRVLIIAGMHRSGTSMMARYVHNSGYNLGEDLVGPKKSNKYGHFEDVEILEFHQRVMERVYSHYEDDITVPVAPVITGEDVEEAQRLLEARKSREHWGWKEPRTTLFLDMWRELLPEARFVLMWRPAEQVTDSLLRRVRMKRYTPRWFRLMPLYAYAWTMYNEHVINFVRAFPERTMLVELGSVLKQPERFVPMLSEFAEYEFDVPTFKELYDPNALTRQAPALVRWASGRFSRLFDTEETLKKLTQL